MKRGYETLINDHFVQHDQMVFIMGPRQVGKTTLAMAIENKKNIFYLNWDDLEDRDLLLAGTQSLGTHLSLDKARETLPVIIFDEIHKYSKWKQTIKGFYDRYKTQCRIIVTGSARLNVFKKGGDSLMGRYFYYRLHPLSVAELLKQTSIETTINPPLKISDNAYQALLKWGGFPEPFLKKNQRFFTRWNRLREQQLLQEDIRELTRIQELGQMEMLAFMIKSQVGQLTSYSSFSKKIRVSVDTIRRWIPVLESLYYCFSIRPWTKNVTRSLLKEPKYYLWDWSQCQSEGARNENFIASHLLKAVHFWNDSGTGNYALYFVRDKEKREVDFLVTKENKPWVLVEVKTSDETQISKSLSYFKKQLNVPHAFQVVINADYVNKDVFEYKETVIVPARTLLSQLV